MERIRITLTLASGTFVVLYLGNRLLAQGAALIPLIGILLAALAIGGTLGAWLMGRAVRAGGVGAPPS